MSTADLALEAEKVFVSRHLPGSALDRLASLVDLEIWDEPTPPARAVLMERLSSSTGFLSMPFEQVDDELLDAAPHLKVVANMAVGFDNLDRVALTARKIPAGNTPGVLTDATADLAMGLILATARRFGEARQQILEGRWRSWDPRGLLGMELNGALLGVVGLGRIGEALVRRARAFGMDVIAFNRHQRPVEGIRYVELDELLATADVISVHVALTEETVGFIGERELSLMKPSSIIINTARGLVIDQQALVVALRDQRIAGAGLDVFEYEPLAADDELLRLSNCVVTPHIGSATDKARAAMAELAVDNILAGLRGVRLPHCINPEVYE